MADAIRKLIQTIESGDYTVFDVETTGLYERDPTAPKPRPVQIAATRFRSGQDPQRWSTFIDPQWPIQPGAVRAHGISQDLLDYVQVKRFDPTLKEAATIIPEEAGIREFFKFARGAPVVGHNIEGFDVRLLKDRAAALGIPEEQLDIADTLKASREAFPGLPSYKLQYLRRELGLTGGVAHRAPGDVETNINLIRKIQEVHKKDPLDLSRHVYRTGMAWWKKGLIGAGAVGAASLYFNLFSGRDDAYNTIEGMQEGGLAGKLRKENTDFGSGFLGQFGRSLKTIFGSKSVLQPQVKGFSQAQIRSFAKEAKQLSPEQFAESMGVTLRKAPKEVESLVGGNFAISPEEGLKALSESQLNVINVLKRHGYEPGKAYVDPSQISNLKKEFIQTLPDVDDPLLDESMKFSIKKLKSISEADMLKATIFHEATEARNLAVLHSKYGLSKIEKLSKSGMPSHDIAISQEELFLRTMGDKKTYTFFGSWRRATSPSGDTPYNELNEIITDYNTPLNPIEGMRHGGLAQKLRKLLTDFGSKYDRMRALAKMLGASFEEFTQHPGFQKALGEAKEIKRLGGGRFGDVHLMEMELGGQQYQMVKKIIPEKKRLRAIDDALKFERKGNTDAFNELIRTIDLSHEAKMMRPLGATEFAPSVYNIPSPVSNIPSTGVYDKRELFMEHMPGEPLFDMLKRGEEVPIAVKRQLEEAVRETAGRNIYNRDIHSANILYDPETKRVSWLDWGLARPVSTSTSRTGGKMMRDYDEYLSYHKKIIQEKREELEMEERLKKPLKGPSTRDVPGNQPANPREAEAAKSLAYANTIRAQQRSLDMAEALRETQKQVWDNAHNAGKNHTRYAGKHVSQISTRHGGNI